MALRAEVELDISKFATSLKSMESQLAQFRRKAQGAGSGGGAAAGSGLMGSLGAGIAGMGAMLTAAMAAAAAAAGVVGGAVLAGGIKRAMEAETVGISFEVLTGSAEKGKAMLDEIRAYGSSSPYEFPGLAEAGRLMLNFGLSTDKVMPTLRSLGDIASGDANKLNSLALAYGQSASAGRLMGGDVLQMINAGFNPLNQIAKKTGESMTDLKKRMEAGLIPFSEVEGAFQAATSAGGLFFGMADRQSRTVSGLFSTLADTWGEVLLSLGTPINDAIRPLLAGSIVLVGDLKKAAEGMGKALASGIQYAVATWQALDWSTGTALLGAALSLAFKGGVNVLWAGMMGTLTAWTQALVEAVKNAITVFQIVTTLNFWAGMYEALQGAALMFNARILDGVSTLLAQLSQVPGMGGYAGAGSVAASAASAVMNQEGQTRMANAGALLAPSVDKLLARAGASLDSVGAAFMRGFSGANDVFDTSKEMEKIQAASAAIATKQRRNSNRAKEAAEQAGATAPAAGTSDASAGGALARNVSGAYAGAINLIMGRSVNTLLLEQAQTTNALLREVAANTKTKPPAPVRPIVQAATFSE